MYANNSQILFGGYYRAKFVKLKSYNTVRSPRIAEIFERSMWSYTRIRIKFGDLSLEFLKYVFHLNK